LLIYPKKYQNDSKYIFLMDLNFFSYYPITIKTRNACKEGESKMVLNNPYQAYQKQAVTTSKPEDLTFMLYEGLVKFIRLSKAALLDKRLEESNSYNLRAQDILSELMVTLKKEYSISEQLLPMYDFMKSRLIEANLKKSEEILVEVEEFAVELSETWATAMKQVKSKSLGLN
jgi:flagellar secretion chaperone FliS